MHPILASRTAIVLYLLIWVPIGCVLGFLLSVTGGMSWRESAAITAPLTLLYAFICMSAWYSCKYLPLGATAAGRLALNQGAAAVAAALLWIVIAKGLALALSRGFAGVDLRLSHEIPLLFVVGIGLYALAVAVHYAALSLEASRDAGQREREARALAGEAELRALKAQINPHFLFNSLNSISALTTVDGARAREMCIKLSDFLRRTLSLGDRETIPLSEEVALTMMYLSVEQVRFGKRLRFEQRFDPECGECRGAAADFAAAGGERGEARDRGVGGGRGGGAVGGISGGEVADCDRERLRSGGAGGIAEWDWPGERAGAGEGAIPGRVAGEDGCRGGPFPGGVDLAVQEAGVGLRMMAGIWNR